MVSARALWLDCQMVAVTQRGSALHRTVGSRYALDCALSGMLELADKPYSEILL